MPLFERVRTFGYICGADVLSNTHPSIRLLHSYYRYHLPTLHSNLSLHSHQPRLSSLELKPHKPNPPIPVPIPAISQMLAKTKQWPILPLQLSTTRPPPTPAITMIMALEQSLSP